MAFAGASSAGGGPSGLGHRLAQAFRLQPVPPDGVAGLRVALSLTLPFLIGALLDDTARWGLVANGAFLVSLVNIGGAYPVRARVSAAAVILLPPTVMVAVLTSDDLWGAAPIALVWVFVCSLMVVWGPRFAFLGLTVAVAYVVYLNQPGDWAAAVEVCWLTFAGGLWGLLLGDHLRFGLEATDELDPVGVLGANDLDRDVAPSDSWVARWTTAKAPAPIRSWSS